MQQDLEKLLKEGVEKNTPEDVKNNRVFNYLDEGEFSFKLTREHVANLNLKSWFKDYKKEALVSTAGIRGPQNILYPHDTRFPINTIGITLATLAKALVLKEKYGSKKLVKLCGREVRYNSEIYLDLISRIQAALGITTLLPVDKQTIPIWLASFLCFKLDLVGGEYITSSHGISVKNATKDLNDQGSQFLPNESMEFVDKIEQILETIEEQGFYEIKFAALNNELLDQKVMQKFNDGIDLYVEYLKEGVASEENLALIRNNSAKIVIDNVGGCAYNTLSKILERLGVSGAFKWLNTKEDPFFHGIGKDIRGGEFYDWSLDVTVLAKNAQGGYYFPVVESLKYGELLTDMPIGTVALITDPDHDRMSVAQIDNAEHVTELERVGVDYSPLNDGRILSIYSANQAFLMMADFWAKSLKNAGKFDNHKRFIIKTTPSSNSWQEWAKANNIAVINTPVGFKEIANVSKKIEAQIKRGEQNITVEDIYGNTIELGADPKLIFGGEESGGMIIGAEGFIKSLSGRKALALREKSASEAIILASALVSSLNVSLWQHLDNIYNENKIISRFDVREDISYYNESEPDIEKLKEAKLLGEAKRTKNDLFFLALAIGYREGKITLENMKEILSTTFIELDFSNLEGISFVGDGTYFKFSNKFVEIRPSGTDAKTKTYAGGNNKAELLKYAKILGNYSGELNETYLKYLDAQYVETSKEKSLAIYDKFAQKGADFEQFSPPEYSFFN